MSVLVNPNMMFCPFFFFFFTKQTWKSTSTHFILSDTHARTQTHVRTLLQPALGTLGGWCVCVGGASVRATPPTLWHPPPVIGWRSLRRSAANTNWNVCVRVAQCLLWNGRRVESRLGRETERRTVLGSARRLSTVGLIYGFLFFNSFLFHVVISCSNNSKDH